MLHGILALLLLFSFQSTLTHTEHLLKEVKECHLCQSEKHLSSEISKSPLSGMETAQTTLQEFVSEISQIVSEPVSLAAAIERKATDYHGLNEYPLPAPPLGFSSRAPPAILL